MSGQGPPSDERPWSFPALLSAVAGVAGVALSGRPAWGLLLGVVAVACAVSALRRSREVRGGGLAILGAVLGTLAVLIGIGWIIYLVVLFAGWSQL